MHPFHARRNRRRPSVCGLEHVAGKILVIVVGAADRRNADGGLEHVHLLQHFGNEPMNDSVRASRTVVEGQVGQPFGSFKNSSPYNPRPFRYVTGALTDASGARYEV
jgi:hypothetical protein